MRSRELEDMSFHATSSISWLLLETNLNPLKLTSIHWRPRQLKRTNHRITDKSHRAVSETNFKRLKETTKDVETKILDQVRRRARKRHKKKSWDTAKSQRNRLTFLKSTSSSCGKPSNDTVPRQASINLCVHTMVKISSQQASIHQ